MKEIKLNNGVFIVVPYGTFHFNSNEIIGLVSSIRESENMAKKVVDIGRINRTYRDYIEDNNFIQATDSFNSLVEKYNLKDSDLIIKKL